MKHYFFCPKSSVSPTFGSCQNCMSSANLVAEIHQKLCNKRALSTGIPCICECVSLHQSSHRGTLSIHWYIAQSFQAIFSMSVFFRHSFKIAIFSRFLKVAIATSNFINESYNGGFAPEFSASILKETVALVSDYVSETRKENAKQRKNIYENEIWNLSPMKH